MGDWDWELIETKKWTKSQIKSDTKLRSEDVILELEEKTAKQRIKEEFVFCGDALVDEEEFETLQNLNQIVMKGISDLEFVATVATSGRVKFLSAV